MSTQEISARLSLKERRQYERDAAAAAAANDRMGRSAEEAGRKAEKSERGWQHLHGTLRVFGRITAATVAGTAGVVAAAATVGVKTAAQMEQSQIAFTTMLGSGRKAQKFLGDLAKFAAATPFELPQLQTAASSLVSIGVEADKVIPIMTSLGNATSGMGTGQEGIKRATVAIQQMNAAGRITAEDLNQLRDAGIPVYDLLTAATGKSTSQIAKMAQTGKLGRKELEQLMTALETGKGLERFNGLMDKQSHSLSGLASTAKDTFSVGMAQAIRPLLPLLKDGLVWAIDMMNKGLPVVQGYLKRVAIDVDRFRSGWSRGQEAVDKGISPWARWGGRARVAISDVHAAVADFTSGFKRGTDDIDSSQTRWARWGAVAYMWAVKVKDSVAGVFPRKGGGAVDYATTLDRVQAGWAKLWPQVQSGARELKGIKPIVDVTSAVFGFLANHLDTLIKYLPLLITAFIAYKTAQAASNVAEIAMIPVRIAHVGALVLEANAQRMLAIAIARSNGVQIPSRIQTAKDTVVKIAHATATAAQAAATKVAAAAQWVFNAAMNANPVSLIIIGVIALVAGLVLLYRKFDIVKIGLLTLGKWGVWAMRMMVAGVLGYLGLLLKGAAKAFGWIPGIGPKLKAADEAFGRFKDGANEKLRGIETRLQVKIDAAQARRSIGALRKEVDQNPFVLRFRPSYGAAGQGLGVLAPTANPQNVAGKRAFGGPVRAGHAYTVNELGRETFVPATDGYVFPHLSMPSFPSITLPDAPAGGDGVELVQHLHVHLDGREIYSSVDRRAENKAARQ